MGEKLQTQRKQPTSLEELSATAESVLIEGDLAKLSASDRVRYYNLVCETAGLNKLTRPFAYLKLNGKLVLYAQKAATDQLRRIHGVSIEVVSRQTIDGLYVVSARATTKDGRTDEDDAAVSVQGLKGENLGNAMMKCVTKAKRRVTLSMCGLGMLDELEAEAVASAEFVDVTDDGEIKNTEAAPEDPNQKAQAFVDGWSPSLNAVDNSDDLGTWVKKFKTDAKAKFGIGTDLYKKVHELIDPYYKQQEQSLGRAAS